MNAFDQELKRRLEDLREQGLYRELRRVDSPQSPRLTVGGRPLLSFSSNDYLGLASDPALKEAAVRGIDQFGAGAGASRLICGSLAPHHELEETLADFKGTPAALSFSSGYAAVLGTLCALMGKGDVVILDKLVHASIVDAARLSGAKLRVFAHNDLDNLETILKWANTRSSLTPHASRLLILTESVFSMDGDRAPLREMVALKEKYGAWLMVDEAHATGLFGQRRRGLAEELGVSDRIEIQLGTLGKAVGAAGGYVCGSRMLVDLLVNRARSFVFSTAPVPAAAAAAAAGLRFIQSEAGKQRCETLWQRVAQLVTLHAARIADSAIQPILIGDEARSVAAAAQLHAQGLFVPAIRYPTVARGQARLRVTLTAAHTADDVAQLVRALESIGNRQS